MLCIIFSVIIIMLLSDNSIAKFAQTITRPLPVDQVWLNALLTFIRCYTVLRSFKAPSQLVGMPILLKFLHNAYNIYLTTRIKLNPSINKIKHIWSLMICFFFFKYSLSKPQRRVKISHHSFSVCGNILNRILRLSKRTFYRTKFWRAAATLSKPGTY